jgi:hypothetical protein
MRGWWTLVARHGMRAYYLPLMAGLALAVSAFRPWVVIGDTALGGVPDPAGLWVLGLGVVAMVLAALSIWTRRNSRHPLLLVGLTAFGILLLAEKLIERTAEQQAWAVAQAAAIVSGIRPGAAADAKPTWGAYLGLGAALVLVLFGLTIVVKRVARPYAEPQDDDA